jgi:TolA-binding protein
MDSQAWLTVILAIIAASPGIYAVWKQTRKDKAAALKDSSDASEAITDSALKLVNPLKKRIDELEKQVSEFETRINHLEDVIHKYATGTKKLTKQLTDNKLNPCWSPAFLEQKR